MRITARLARAGFGGLRGAARRLALLALVAIALSACDSPPGQGGAGYAQSRNGVTFWATPRAMPPMRFHDGGGRAHSLADFKGKLVLLNVWATWCGPCREEMPSLDRLQAQLGGEGFAVVAVSIDRDRADRSAAQLVRDFYADFDIHRLGVYVDAGAGAEPQVDIGLNAPGIPITLLVDAEGREIGRKLGAAAWDSPEMIQMLRQFAAPPPAS